MMRKNFFILTALAGFLMLSCASKNSVPVEDHAPIIHEIFYSVNEPELNASENPNDWPRIQVLNLAKSIEEVEDDELYSIVVDLTDLDKDYSELHLSFDDFETEQCYEIEKLDGERIWKWWNNAYIFSSDEEAMANISAYIVDEKGNQSEIYSFSVYGLSKEAYPEPISED